MLSHSSIDGRLPFCRAEVEEKVRGRSVWCPTLPPAEHPLGLPCPSRAGKTAWAVLDTFSMSLAQKCPNTGALGNVSQTNKQINKRSPNASVNLSERTRVSSALILSLAHGCLQFLTKAQVLVWGYEYTCEIITLLGSNGTSSLR